MTSEDSSDALAPPELTFRYSDFVLIGTGGMGRVLGANDNRLARSVAIKLLPRNSENALAVMRFQQEAKAVSKLNNPHVVQVLDFGYTEAGEPYLVMEHVQGSSLQSCLETRDALPILEAINIAVQLCEALGHAHANDVIHRDLKPGNIMIEAGNIAKVLDFGLARIASENEDWRLTRPGQPVGSILYMSPEQVRGEESDERSDIYSLGLVILKMVVGQLPFEGRTSLEIIKIRSEEEPPAIPEFDGTRLDHILRIDLNEVLQKALAFHPEDRYANMSEFRDALLNVVEHANQIIAAENKEKTEAALKKTNRDKVFGTVVLIGVTLSLVSYLAFSMKRTQDEKRLSKKHPVIKSESDAKIRKEIVRKREALIAEKFEVEDRAHGLWKAGPTVSDEDLLKLIGIPISQITFQDNHIVTHKGMETLSKFPIRWLSVRNTDIDDRSIPFIAKMKNLFYVDFQESLVTDAGIKMLPKDLNLQYVDVKKLTGVTDIGLLHIIDSYPNFKLLSISGSGVGRKGFRQIPRLKHLEILRAAGLALTDDDINSISNMESLALDIQSNAVTDKSIPTFEKMKLRSLNLEMCALISQKGLKRLHDEMKGTTVTPQPVIEVEGLDRDALEMLNGPGDPAITTP